MVGKQLSYFRNVSWDHLCNVGPDHVSKTCCGCPLPSNQGLCVPCLFPAANSLLNVGVFRECVYCLRVRCCGWCRTNHIHRQVTSNANALIESYSFFVFAGPRFPTRLFSTGNSFAVEPLVEAVYIQYHPFVTRSKGLIDWKAFVQCVENVFSPV